MATISIEYTDTCPNCGSHNWKLNGSVINDGIDITKISLSCMRCRTIIHSKTSLTHE
jgi:hypothetical protein